MKPKTRTPDDRQGDLFEWADARPEAAVIPFDGEVADACFARRLWARLDKIDQPPDRPAVVVRLRA